MPRSETVRSAHGAVEAANEMGYPVVVKPLDGNHGRGVNLDLRTEEDVRRAFPLALSREPRRLRGGGDLRQRQRPPRAGHRRQDGRHRRSGSRPA